MLIPAVPMWIDRLVVHTDSYELDHGELAHSSAAIAAPSMTAAPPVSVVRKVRTGAARLRAQAVRPPSVAVSTVADIGSIITGLGRTSSVSSLDSCLRTQAQTKETA